MACAGPNLGANYPNYCTGTQNAALQSMGAELLDVVTSRAGIVGFSFLETRISASCCSKTRPWGAYHVFDRAPTMFLIGVASVLWEVMGLPHSKPVSPLYYLYFILSPRFWGD